MKPQKEPMRPRGWSDKDGMASRKVNGYRARQPKNDRYKSHRRS